MTVFHWILVFNLACLAIISAIVLWQPVIRPALRDLLPGWDDEDVESAARKWRNHAEPWEYSNRELQALKAMGLWPR